MPTPAESAAGSGAVFRHRQFPQDHFVLLCDAHTCTEDAPHSGVAFSYRQFAQEHCALLCDAHASTYRAQQVQVPSQAISAPIPHGCPISHARRPTVVLTLAHIGRNKFKVSSSGAENLKLDIQHYELLR